MTLRVERTRREDERQQRAQERDDREQVKRDEARRRWDRERHVVYADLMTDISQWRSTVVSLAERTKGGSTYRRPCQALWRKRSC